MNNYCKIPNIIFQTSREKPPQYLINMIKTKAPYWRYKHYDDSEIIEYFKNNPLEEFPLIIQKFNSIKGGAHKADLFRYYYLYINGGVFLDSDAMLQTNLIYCARNCDFFSVNSNACEGCIFQGFLGTTPKNPIIYDALKDAYNINVNQLANDYLLLCRNLYNMIKNNNYNLRIAIYQEVVLPTGIVLSINPIDNKLVLVHYYVSKIVPPHFFNYKQYLIDKLTKATPNSRVII